MRKILDTTDKGATVLDFAFFLHEIIGLFTTEAIVNGKRNLRLETPLSNGDHVRIISAYYKGAAVEDLGPAQLQRLFGF